MHIHSRGKTAQDHDRPLRILDWKKQWSEQSLPRNDSSNKEARQAYYEPKGDEKWKFQPSFDQ